MRVYDNATKMRQMRSGDSESFKFKVKITGSTPVGGNKKMLN